MTDQHRPVGVAIEVILECCSCHKEFKTRRGEGRVACPWCLTPAHISCLMHQRTAVSVSDVFDMPDKDAP